MIDLFELVNCVWYMLLMGFMTHPPMTCFFTPIIIISSASSLSIQYSTPAWSRQGVVIFINIQYAFHHIALCPPDSARITV